MEESSGVDALEGPLFMLRTIFNVFWKPFIWLLSWIVALVYILASPVLALANGLLTVAGLPLRILLKFEAFLYYATGAVLTGASVGLLLYFTNTALFQLLQRHNSTEPPLLEDSESVKDEPIDWESKWTDPSPKLSSTIVEEEENSQDSP
ncbi:hypothetical protein N7468_000395 [Penicillium chermesinum]|uniref:Uncharacterized protein n=1 Tax=Penicillium chermesinum TaxID=63820 RepID=A0A9W9TYT2_9EURO|nr:uncharacterized protein N7468_000395 [Penicillium chermesinum]KAJ5248944.1 hypothetical protein N7468_000395 [Penicillium chermesinum]KAJ6151049.1 hypothetical protein N7470_007643 [Penicillium chermesinum]